MSAKYGTIILKNDKMSEDFKILSEGKKCFCELPQSLLLAGINKILTIKYISKLVFFFFFHLKSYWRRQKKRKILGTELSN